MQAHVHLEDVAAGVALAAERGRPGETYLLAGEPIACREYVAIGPSAPAAPRCASRAPAALMAGSFALAEPLLRAAGPPAFMSRETARANDADLRYSGEKARRELGWAHRGARAAWGQTVERELSCWRAAPGATRPRCSGRCRRAQGRPGEQRGAAQRGAGNTQPRWRTRLR